MKFNSDDEVIVLANDSYYGLGCAVFSGNQKRAISIASQLHCGVAAINDFASSYMCQVISFSNIFDQYSSLVSLFYRISNFNIWCMCLWGY